jgi:hypothetical protein
MASRGPYCWLDSADLIMKITFAHAQVCPAQKQHSVRVLVFRFYYDVFVEHLQTLSKKFLPETDAAIEELLSFRVEV